MRKTADLKAREWRSRKHVRNRTGKNNDLWKEPRVRNNLDDFNALI